MTERHFKDLAQNYTSIHYYKCKLIFFFQDKKYYPSAQEVYGPDVEVKKI